MKLNTALLPLLAFLSVTSGNEPVKIASFGQDPGLGDPVFYLPRKILPGPDGTLFVLDAGHANIQVFTPEGHLVRTIGSRGQGPGEFLEPVDMILENENLWVLDHSSMRVSLFTFTGQFLYSFPTRIMPFAFTTNGGLFTCSHLLSDDFLVQYNLQGDTQHHSLDWQTEPASLDLTRINPFRSMAYLATGRDSTLYVSYLYRNRIEAYSPNLELLDSRSLDRGLEDSNVKRSTSSQVLYVEGPEISQGLMVVGEYIYVLWSREDPSGNESTDVSLISVFDYQLKRIRTVSLGDRLTGFSVRGNLLYGTMEDPPGVVIYDMSYAD